MIDRSCIRDWTSRGNQDIRCFVDFQAQATYVGAYHRLYTDLINLFSRPVDLIIETDFSNPSFREAVEHSRTPLYAAWGLFI